MSTLRTPDDLGALRTRLIRERGEKRRRIHVCSGTGCIAAKAGGCAEALARELASHGLARDVEVKRTGCYGLCERGPVVVVEPEGVCYLGVKAADAAEIVEKTVVKHETVERLVYEDEKKRPVARLEDIPFYKAQQRVLLDANTKIDPHSIDDYIAIGGYTALVRVLTTMKPDEVVALVKESGLRGRGGGGFPTGVKWETTRKAPGDVKYVIVNADEGDPGAYMDRSLLEGNPHSIIEGLMIGAFAIGAKEGYVYVRQEYPLAVENTLHALEQARAYGLLGENVLGTGFSFDVHVHKGAGAFVSGESSALMTAIEGRVGLPRPKYVHTSVCGLWDKPSNLNNVETWANVPLIVNQGAAWFRAMGTEGSKGTKVFSLVGKVRNTGLVEVPMGKTLRQIVFDIGGGVPNGKRLKAVQTGGPSGGFIPEKLIDTPVDFDELWNAGSMMGSGGMIVMDEDSCMVDAARFYVRFLAHESCGQCVPCREGLRQMQRILDRMVKGEGREGDIETLLELCDLLEDASLCALGGSAPFPVRSAIKHFRHEFEAHIREKRCPSLVCMDLVEYQIAQDECPGCSVCKKACPSEAVVGVHKKPYTIDQSKCVKCGNCLTVCPPKIGAVHKVPKHVPSPKVVPIAARSAARSNA